MLRLTIVALFAVALFAGCGKKESTPTGGGSGSSSTPASKYGSPEDTAKTFFATCAAADWKAMGECISKTAPGIGELREGKLSDGEKETFKTSLGAAKLGAVTKAADGKTAEVKFVAKRGDKDKEGSLKLELTGTEWKITDLH